MPDMTHSILIVAMVAVVTIIIRALPFAVFREGRKTPAFIVYLGKVLPYAIMGMLVIFCLKNISFIDSPHGIPELISCVVVAGLHLWRKNTLLSIGAGTLCYMLLVQLVF